MNARPTARASRTAIAALVAVVFLLAMTLDASNAQQQRQRQPAQPPPRGAPATPPAPANPLFPETSARQLIIADVASGAILLEKNPDERMPPSSMSKIMTAYVVFEALRRGDLRLEDTLPVSERAWRMQGSKMFVPLGERVKVEDLLRGMIIQSGNDACIVLAEGLAGSEEGFAERMNETARRIGLVASKFRNSSGWPDPEHYMTARDLLTLSARLVADFPEFYRYYGEREFAFGREMGSNRTITQPNRNPLLQRMPGADGIKTGHTESAGYGLLGSAIRENRRVILVANGWPTMRARAEESERLLEWAFREFGAYTLFKAGQPIEEAPVWMGRLDKVNLVAAQDVVVTIPRRLRAQLAARASFDGPVAAPIRRGQPMGTLTITVPDRPAASFALVAGDDVEKLGFGGRVAAGLSHLVLGRR